MSDTDRQKDLEKILAEADRLQAYYAEIDPATKKTRRWVKEDRETFERLCAEGAELQAEIEAEAKYAELERRREQQSRLAGDPTLPASRSHAQATADAKDVAGYVTLGDAVVMSEAFQDFSASGYATGTKAVVQLAGALIGRNVVHGPRGEPLIALNREGRKMFERFARESKAVPTLGTGVLDPDRVARIPQVTADERLRIRDVISTGQTGAGSVEYVREDSSTNAAAPTAHGAIKPEESVVYSLQSTPVRTVAGWMPVQNQQVEDWAQLRGLIDGRLRYSVQRTEEEQVLYGDGTGVNLEGICVVAGTTDIATNGRYSGATHTLIDVVKMGISDVMVSGYEANAAVMHPFDWEAICLEKGTDDRYVWVVVTDATGSRIWGVRVVEAIGAESRSTGQRNIIVGDWNMGAQLLDRMVLTVQVGLVDDQFVRNMRTILAEERIALPIYAPAAFALFETVAAGS